MSLYCNYTIWPKDAWPSDLSVLFGHPIWDLVSPCCYNKINFSGQSNFPAFAQRCIVLLQQALDLWVPVKRNCYAMAHKDTIYNCLILILWQHILEDTYGWMVRCLQIFIHIIIFNNCFTLVRVTGGPDPSPGNTGCDGNTHGPLQITIYTLLWAILCSQFTCMQVFMNTWEVHAKHK